MSTTTADAKTVVAGFRVDFELGLAESLQSRDCLGTCVHLNRYNLNEKKTCTIMCEREMPVDRPMKSKKENTEETEDANETIEPAESSQPIESNGQSKPEQETRENVVAEDDSVEPTENDPLYSPFFERLRMGQPLELLKAELERKGLDPGMLDPQQGQQQDQQQDQQRQAVIFEYLMSNDGTEIWSSVTEFLAKSHWESSEDPACNNCNEQRTSVLNVANVVRASVQCGDCDEYYCRECFGSIHSGGKRKLHEIIWRSGGDGIPPSDQQEPLVVDTKASKEDDKEDDMGDETIPDSHATVET